MARNANITKLKRQKYKRRRGTFKPLSDDGLNNGQTFVSEKLKPYWSENLRVRPRGGGQSRVNRSNIPEEYLGYVDYRAHAKTLGAVTHVLGVHSKSRYDYIYNAIYKSPPTEYERKAVDAVLPEITETFACVVVERTRFTILWLFYNGSKSCAFFVKQEKCVLHGSITYGSMDRAKAVFRSGEIRWKQLHVIQPP